MTERNLVPLRNGLDPVAWRILSPVEKLQHLYDESLDVCLEALQYRGNNKHEIYARTQARHDVMMICAKYAIEGNRARVQTETLAQLARGLAADSLASDEKSSASNGNRNKPARRNSAKSLKS